ncbi:prenyltransferase/squalene oxidase repeat-containing protein [Methanocella conradii]|nr:prenyltransferase/squalene oxidase repeat-containing protein [Methanocella conradii]
MMAPSSYDRYINVEALASYILKRRNPDGGFCFYGLDESSLNDAFYAVMVLDLLGRLPTDDRTVEYVRSFQNDDGGFISVYSAWCTLKALKALGASPRHDPGEYLLQRFRSHRIRDDVYIESLSIFESSFYLADMLAMTGRRELCKDIAGDVLRYERGDGSFGQPGGSSLMSTYFALAILGLAGTAPADGEKVANYVRARAVKSGGFSKRPETGLAFMDETYYAVKILEALGEKPDNIRETIGFIAACQNENGGFRRARASGISGFDTSYYAVESLRALINV